MGTQYLYSKHFSFIAPEDTTGVDRSYKVIYLTAWITINWEILKEMGIPDHLTCLLRNLYAGQEAIVRNMEHRLVPNRKRSMSRLYIVTLLI